MRALVFGALEFDRTSIPPELETWPTVDHSALDEPRRATYLQRAEAMRLFVLADDLSLTEIEARTGVSRRTFTRMLARCITFHADGRIQGFRALIPHARLKSYTRTVPVLISANGGNTSGAFSQLLTCYPQIATWLARMVRNRARPTNGRREVRQNLRRIHKQFLDKCRELNITAAQYPFNRDHQGKRSLAAHIKRLVNASFDTAAADAGAHHIGRAWSSDIETMKKPVTRPYEAVEFDGHKIDVRLTVRVLDPFGFEIRYEIGRIWILVIMDVATRAVLGYTLALGVEYTKDDAVQALQAALIPQRRRELKIPGLTYRPEGGMPSELMPDLQYACWDWFRCDNAKAHLSEHTLQCLTEVVGSWPDLGPAGEPNERSYVERFFGLVAEHMAHRLPGTTGSNPQDVCRALGDPGRDTRLLIRLDELEEIVDVIIFDYNGESHDGLGGRTPLEAMRYFLTKHSEPVRTLARARRNDVVLLQESRVATVKGNAAKAVRPHINFHGARYSSDVLSGNAALIGKKLRIYFDARDLRRVRAYFENGDELGVLIAARPWCFTAHSLRIRREILRLRALGKLRYREGDDAVEAWANYKRKQAPRSRRAARDLARLTTPRQRATSTGEPAIRDVTQGNAASRGGVYSGSPQEGGAMGKAVERDRTAGDLMSGIPSEPDQSAEPRVKPLRIKKAIVF